MTTDKNTDALDALHVIIGIDWDCSSRELADWVRDNYETIRAALEAKAVDAENAHDMIRYLLPLAKGYVTANPGIRLTEIIIEDAEAMIAEAGRGK